MQRHAADNGRVIEVVNLDPAAEVFDYQPLVDIRELIHLDDAMDDEELHYGPNGGLVFCLEYLIENSSWLQDQLCGGSDTEGCDDPEDDYILFDLPGQIELYTHLDTGKQLARLLESWNFRVCSVFMLDSQFMVDGAKFLSGTMTALSVMVNLEIPHVNLLNKMDLLNKEAKKQLEKYLEPDSHALLAETSDNSAWGRRYRSLSEAIGRLIEDFSLVKFFPLNIQSEENIADILVMIDNAIQYGEDTDVRTRDFDCQDDDDEENVMEDKTNYLSLGDN